MSFLLLHFIYIWIHLFLIEPQWKMHRKKENLTENRTTIMVSEIQTKESSMKKTQVSWISFGRNAKTKVETSSLRNFKNMPRNLNETVSTFMNFISVLALSLQYLGEVQFSYHEHLREDAGISKSYCATHSGSPEVELRSMTHLFSYWTGGQKFRLSAQLKDLRLNSRASMCTLEYWTCMSCKNWVMTVVLLATEQHPHKAAGTGHPVKLSSSPTDRVGRTTIRASFLFTSFAGFWYPAKKTFVFH